MTNRPKKRKAARKRARHNLKAKTRFRGELATGKREPERTVPRPDLIQRHKQHGIAKVGNPYSVKHEERPDPHYKDETFAKPKIQLVEED